MHGIKSDERYQGDIQTFKSNTNGQFHDLNRKKTPTDKHQYTKHKKKLKADQHELQQKVKRISGSIERVCNPALHVAFVVLLMLV